MEPSKNPFAPGAGMPPPELAGRDELLSEARLTIQRNKNGNSARSFIYVGLRGVGKTVLLNEVQAIADDEKSISDFIEVSVNEPLSKVIIPTMRVALLKLDRIKNVSEKVKQGLRILKSFVGAMAELGPGPYRSGDIAKLIGKSTSQLGTTREGLIKSRPLSRRLSSTVIYKNE